MTLTATAALLLLSSFCAASAIQNEQTAIMGTGTGEGMPTPVPAQETRLKQDVSSYLGALCGTTLHHAGLRAEDFDFDALIRTFATTLANAGQSVSEENAIDERKRLVLHFVQSRMEHRNDSISLLNAERSRRFLEENEKKPGIVTTPSGLQYRIDKQGSEPVQTRNRNQQTHHDEYGIKYTVATLDGTIIDNPKGAISTIRNFRKPGRIPEGFNEALELMPPGAAWTLYIPPSIGFGDRLREMLSFSLGERQAHFDQTRICQPCIHGNSVLIMKVELVEYRPDKPLSLEEIDSIMLVQNDFWSKSALASADIRLCLIQDFNTWHITPEALPVEEVSISEQEMHLQTSEQIAQSLAARIKREGFTLSDIDLKTFQNQLQTSIDSPLSMEELGRLQPVMNEMAARIQSREHRQPYPWEPHAQY